MPTTKTTQPDGHTLVRYASGLPIRTATDADLAAIAASQADGDRQGRFYDATTYEMAWAPSLAKSLYGRA